MKTIMTILIANVTHFAYRILVLGGINILLPVAIRYYKFKMVFSTTQYFGLKVMK